jgi:hypothetical protein
VPLAGGRLFLALDAGAVSAALVGGGLKGRAVSFERQRLNPGALVPSPSGQNLHRPEEVRDALRRAIEPFERRPTGCTLVLPDGIGRLALLALPRGDDPREFVRFRLMGSLSWPQAEAVVDFLTVGGRRVVGAALRRTVVAEYEQVAASVGLAPERVHLAPLLVLDAILRDRPCAAVHVVLGDTAACFAVVRDGALVALRSRRRDGSAGEARRLVEDAGRTAGLVTNGLERHTVVLSGADSTRLCEEAADGGTQVRVGPSRWPEAAEAAWLGGLLA